MKHLLKLLDLSGQEIIEILNLADQLKYELKHGISHPYLKDQTLGMIFQKSSTRTRVSFQVGMGQLGGSALFLSSRDLQIGRGEAVEDTARVLSRYLDGIMIRTFAQEEVEDLAKYGSIPIINGLTDFCHPCQVLADLLTVREYKGSLEGLNLCYIGDGNNMANSLIVGGLKVGMKVSVATPGDYQPDAQVLAFAKGYPGQFKLVSSPKEAAAGADVVEGYQINDALLRECAPDVMVQHCLPAHRGEEITAEVFEAHANEIFDEAENRLHAQKAVLVKTMAKDFQKEPSV